jgi:hypothetical protein
MHRKSYLIKNGFALYLHFGSEPNILELLNNNYQTEELAEELFQMGDMIQLGENIEKSVFFSRDAGSKIESCLPVELETIYTGDSIKYVFESGVWRRE